MEPPILGWTILDELVGEVKILLYDLNLNLFTDTGWVLVIDD